MAVQVKAVVPPPYNTKAWEAVISKELLKQAGIVQRMYKRTVRTWSSPRPQFTAEGSLKSPGPRGGKASKAMSFEVSTDDERFIWTDLGTKRHKIPRSPRPVGSPLRFRVGGRPKTKVRKIGSGAGARGSQWRSSHQVDHPGTKARKFTEEIEKRRRKPFFKAMFAANDRGLRAAQRGR